MLIQPDGLLGGLDRHIEYLLSRTAYCVVGPVWRSPRVFECGLGFSSETCMAQPPSASGDGLGLCCFLTEKVKGRACSTNHFIDFLRAGRLIKTLPVPSGTLVRERVRLEPAAS